MKCCVGFVSCSSVPLVAARVSVTGVISLYVGDIYNVELFILLQVQETCNTTSLVCYVCVPNLRTVASCLQSLAFL